MLEQHAADVFAMFMKHTHCQRLVRLNIANMRRSGVNKSQYSRGWQSFHLSVPLNQMWLFREVAETILTLTNLLSFSSLDSL